MEPFLGGKTAIVTGGTRGIGRSVAEALLANGAAVAICGQTEAGVARAVAEMKGTGNIVGCKADVSEPAEVATLFQFADREFGGLDILINNAGIGVFRAAAELTVEEWQRTVSTNLNGSFYCAREALQRFKSRGGGYVINISSLAGKNPFAGGAAYNASKFGLNGFSEAMMLDHRYDNVRVSYIMPGSVATEFSPQGAGADWRIAPEDIAELVLTLLRMPERTLVSRVEVRPSKPRK
jgi:NAD(P)-dependent dehydrogenase (short-subunit alcohol dehydrogenase family)